MKWLCRDCCGRLTAPTPARRCPRCRGRRLKAHEELAELTLAHIDCDAFYASVEKRDNPALRDRPVIVGGGTRGVVAAACYVARLYGVRSAMPMFKALTACPEAVVIKPDMAKYRRVGLAIRTMMQEMTPLVEPLSIDEAFLDLAGVKAGDDTWPAERLARFAKRVESELRLTVSIGLSYNKFLAKIASDLDKPRGFAILGRTDAPAFLAERPVAILWGVGRAMERRLIADGIRKVGDLLRFPEAELVARYGSMGRRLYRFARGEDSRRVEPDAPAKSISAETTFNHDLSDPVALASELRPLCETVARRLCRAGLAARGINLKLKTSDFRLLSRSHRLSEPTQQVAIIFREGERLLRREADGRRFRLIGIGGIDLVPGTLADPPDLFERGITEGQETA